MSSSLNKQRSSSKAEATVSKTIDCILTKGATKLYDKYIQAKIPDKLSNKLSNLINLIMEPVANTNGNLQAKGEKVHQSVINKISVIKNQDKNNRFSRIYQSRLDKSIMQKDSTKVSKKRVRQSDRSTQYKHMCKRKTNHNSESLKKLDQTNDFDSIELIRAERGKRYDSEKQKIIDEQQLFQKNQFNRQRLQRQLKQLQQANQHVAFDYEPGRMIIPQKKKDLFGTNKAKTETKNNNFINLRFSCDQEHSKGYNTVCKEVEITNCRKITQFERTKKSKNKWTDMDNQCYNNNGQRQYSSIPFIQMKEGVKMTEVVQDETQRPQSSNKPCTASTYRTFKSYTRERLQSIAALKTIDIITPNTQINTRYLDGESKESKRSSNPKRSLLSSRTCSKDHRITKNLQHFGIYFDLSGQTIE